MYKNRVSWKYYVAQGTQPDCEDAEATCAAMPQAVGTAEIWNPVPWFTTVKQDGQLGNIQTIGNFYQDAKSGHLPAVSWIVTNGKVSEHPTALVSEGQTYVTTLINAIMNSSDWSSTAIFLAWDDWGGFYDHVVPPAVDQKANALRPPGIRSRPSAKPAETHHQTFSVDPH